MKKLIILLFAISISCNLLACGYYWEGMSFYNLFEQTNISAEEYYPFLKTENSPFYEADAESNKVVSYPIGNIKLWSELLTNWSINDIENAVYHDSSFNWSNKNLAIEKSAQNYLVFAQKCARTFSYRNRIKSWDYNEIQAKQNVDTQSLLTEANLLLNQESNEQLKARYYYQLIRIMHYSQMWNDAIMVFENNIEGKISKNEIYYYILDQVAGCYYSTKNYDKAAYMFTKVVNQSYDRKKSAFSSYNFCARNGFEGKQYFNGVEDEKDLLLIKSLYKFSDRLSSIKEFIILDANDSRIELLFMRLLNDIERKACPKYIGVSNKSIPNTDKELLSRTEKLILIATEQVNSRAVINKDFWLMASSYLHFINHNLDKAKFQLKKVHSFEKQKQVLSNIYQVFTWDTMNRDNEDAFIAMLRENQSESLSLASQTDWINMCLDKIAHIYYTQNDLAKAFLIHNQLEEINYLTSVELLISMEQLYNKQNKTDFENILISNKCYSDNSFIDYIHNQRGVYYIYNHKLDSALFCFNKIKAEKKCNNISAEIFSNNTKEGFTFPANKIMDDEVYKADVFSFIKPNFSRKELAEYLLKLEKLRHDNKIWKRKLANYLLGNFYFNISNTGYYRGTLNNRSNVGHYSYLEYDFYRKNNPKYDAEIINNRIGYNLSDIVMHRNKYRRTSDIARSYYENTINESTDDELIARCLFMLAKCDLNDYYNLGSDDYYSVKLKYRDLILPESESFKLLKEKYSNTKFHDMIIQECSYFRHYSAIH